MAQKNSIYLQIIIFYLNHLYFFLLSLIGIKSMGIRQPTAMPSPIPSMEGSRDAATASDIKLNEVAPTIAPSKGFESLPSLRETQPSMSTPRYIPIRTIPLSTRPNINPSNNSFLFLRSELEISINHDDKLSFVTQ